MSVKADATMLDVDANMVDFTEVSGGLNPSPPAGCNTLPSCPTVAMEVDKENMGNEADASRSEAASVCAATEASITRSQYQTSDCPEGLEVQESAAVSPEQGAAKLTSEEALRRLERVAIGGTGPPGLMGDPINGLEATHEVIKVVCVASHNLFEQRKKEIRWVTETAQLDRYEAIGCVLAEVLGTGELLLKEARPIGKRALERIEGKSGVKARTEKIKQKAKTARSNATAKAKKDPALATALSDTICSIDHKHILN